jgi:hypothetical protein
MNKKFCTLCRWHEAQGTINNPWHVCRAPQHIVVSPVTGDESRRVTDCDIARATGDLPGYCGKAGKFFAPIDPKSSLEADERKTRAEFRAEFEAHADLEASREFADDSEATIL